MKKTLSVLLSAVTILTYSAVSTSAFADTVQAKYEKSEVTVNPFGDNTESTSIDCLFRSDMPNIPFIKAEDFIGNFYNLNSEQITGDGNVYKFKNGDYTMTIDVDKDIVSFDLYEGFLSFNPKDCIKELMGTGYSFIEDGFGREDYGDLKGVEFDLSDYNIDVIENDGDVYLPFCTLNDIFSGAGYSMSYKNGKISIINIINQMGAKGSFEETRSKEYAEFNYNEICFSIDYFYGKTSNALLSDTIKEKGLDKALESYNSVTPKIKELLLSESTKDYCTGIVLLDYYLEDKGHTDMTVGMTSRLKKYGITDYTSAAIKVFGENSDNKDVAELIYTREEHDNNSKKSSLITSMKNNAYKNFEIIKQWQGIALYKYGNTYFFDFSGFSTEVVEPFKWSMDYAEEHGAEFFIVDVNSNGGGDDNVASYMVALMSGNADHYEKYIVSGNLRSVNGRIDRNLDGKFDEKDDELKYSFRCAVFASQSSYSCAHIFPSLAQDHGICIVGEITSGGSCSVIPKLYSNGTGYNVSADTQYLRYSGVNPDNPVVPDVAMPGSEYNYEGFYDIDTAIKGIAKFYGDPEPKTTSNVKGDMDGDNLLTASDALMILRASVGTEELTETQTALADVDGDNQVTANDALEVLRISINIV